MAKQAFILARRFLRRRCGDAMLLCFTLDRFLCGGTPWNISMNGRRFSSSLPYHSGQARSA